MKTTIMATLFTIILTFSASQTVAEEGEIAEVLIGTGTGAVLGHVVGGNAESALIGSVLGGIIGVSEGHIRNRGRISSSPYIYHDSPRSHYYTTKKHHRRYFTPGIRSCRIEKYITYEHGRKYIVKESVCRGDSPSRHHRFQHPYSSREYGTREYGSRDFGYRGYGNRDYRGRGNGHQGYNDWRSKQRDWRR